MRTALMLNRFISSMSRALGLGRHGEPVLEVLLVTIHALDQDRPAVDQQLAVADFHLAEADPAGDDLQHLAARRPSA